MVNKEFSPEHEEEYTTYIYVDEICIPIISTTTYPDKWTVTIRSLVDARESTHEIDRATYDRIRLNEYYRIGMIGSSPQHPTEGSPIDGGWHR